MEEPPRAECPNCARLMREVAALRAEVQALREELRRSKRQAAPFSKDRPKSGPKTPGRKPGHPPACRAAPAPEAVSQTIRVPLWRCAHCAGPLERVRDNRPIFQSDLPRIEPLIRRFETQRGWCPRCRKMVHSRHPEQTSTATGAAGSQLGPNALALAADLKHRLGLSFRKVADLFAQHLGLNVSPGAFALAHQRLARRAEPLYERLKEQIRTGTFVHADETGWRVGGASAWLWDFVTPQATVYVIRPSRGHQVVQEVLGTAFPGTLVTDGLPTYDAVRSSGRQLCLAHLIRRAADLEKAKSRGAVRFPRAVLGILRQALELRSRSPTLSAHGLAVARGRIKAALDRLLRYHLIDPDNERLGAHLHAHREHLLTFLDEPAVEPTNNIAERQLRPAVIARKLSAGNRTARGAFTHAVLASLAATCRQRGERFTDLAVSLLCREPPRTTLSLAPVRVPA